MKLFAYQCSSEKCKIRFFMPYHAGLNCPTCGADAYEKNNSIDNRPIENELIEALEDCLQLLNKFAPSWSIGFTSLKEKHQKFKEVLSKAKGEVK